MSTVVMFASTAQELREDRDKWRARAEQAEDQRAALVLLVEGLRKRAERAERERDEAQRNVCVAVLTGDPRGYLCDGEHALDDSSLVTVAAGLGWDHLYPET